MRQDFQVNFKLKNINLIIKKKKKRIQITLKTRQNIKTRRNSFSLII